MPGKIFVWDRELRKYRSLKAGEILYMPCSQSQLRALKLLNISTVQHYKVAASALKAAGWPGNGVPEGFTWQTAAKLSDGMLLAAVTENCTI